jgi:hypothetical protein
LYSVPGPAHKIDRAVRVPLFLWVERTPKLLKHKFSKFRCRKAQRDSVKSKNVVISDVISKEEDAMINQKLVSAALLFIAVGPLATGASAITAEVAKKCEILTSKAFPPRQAGNPAAGSAKGTAQTQRAYFSKCVANGGKADDSGTTETK